MKLSHRASTAARVVPEVYRGVLAPPSRWPQFGRCTALIETTPAQRTLAWTALEKLILD